MYHLSRIFRVIPPGHALRWNPLLVILIYGCYVINLNSMMIRRRCWFSMLSTVLLPSSVNFNVATSSVTSSASAKNIGVVPNSTLSLDKTLSKFANLPFIQLGTLRASESFSVSRQRRSFSTHLLPQSLIIVTLLSPQELLTAFAICFELCSWASHYVRKIRSRYPTTAFSVTLVACWAELWN